MNDLALPLSGLSSVGGKSVVARFDGGMLSSNSGVLALAEVEKRLRMAERLARCIDDPRCPDQVVHSLADMIGFRMKMVAAGYEDGNDANRLRRALDTFDAVHGGQQLRLFNAHHDEYGFQPILVFDGAGRFVSAIATGQAAEWG